jgi:hypothetical protein
VFSNMLSFTFSCTNCMRLANKIKFSVHVFLSGGGGGGFQFESSLPFG